MLGDRVAAALAAVGITKERVSKALGRPCGCQERQEKLNALERWARRVLLGKTEKAEEYLKDVLGETALDHETISPQPLNAEEDIVHE